MGLYLKRLSVDDGKDIYEMLQQIDVVENSFTNPVNGMSYDKYKNWLIEQDDWSRGINLPDGYVGQTIYWLMLDNIPIGIGKIRHKLTESSRKEGGNIGYAIGKQWRGNGYGNKILELLICEIKAMGIDETVLTVDKGNYASRKVILNNGGKQFDENEFRWYFSF